MRADFGEQRPEGLEKRALAVLAQRKGCTTGGVILATIGFSRVSPVMAFTQSAANSAQSFSPT